MAEEPENRMLFDLRGRRKRVIQVIYVMLAFIMAASLLVIGLPGGLNPFNSGSSVVSQDAADLSKERAERLEQKIAAQPEAVGLRAVLIRERILAGNSLVEVNDQQQVVGAEATEQYQIAAEEWEQYVKETGGKPDRGVAQLVAGTLFTLAQGSTVAQFEGNMRDAARAQSFVAEDGLREFETEDGPPPTGLFVTLATYEYYAQNFGAAEKARQKALKIAGDEANRKEVNRTLDQIEEDARKVGKQIEQAKKQARKNKGQSVEQPFGNLGTQATTGTTGVQP